MMLTQGTRQARRALVYGVSGGAAVGGVSLAVYANTVQGLGLRREVQFWKAVLPVVGDYMWKTHSKSPYVWWQQQQYKLSDQQHQQQNEQDEPSETDDERQERQRQQRRQAVFKELHQNHAPEMLAILLELKGLYVKLGQVLSVTAIPIPDAYRNAFRTLQSDVSGWEPFDEVVRPVIEAELGRPMEEIFSHVDPIPCGAASIGQAHKATLRRRQTNDDGGETELGEQVIIKVQYPDAKWQVPADIHCIGDFIKLCVWLGVVEESSARLSYAEFARQFLAELDYERECQNLKDVYQSSLDPTAPYQKRGVVVPQVYDELCTKQIITMTYLPGPKLQAEAQRQLQRLGMDTSSSQGSALRRMVLPKEDGGPSQQQQPSQSVPSEQDTTKTDGEANAATKNVMMSRNTASWKTSAWKMYASQWLGTLVGVDSMLWAARFAQRLLLWSTVLAVTTIQTMSPWLLFLSSSSSSSPSLSLTEDHEEKKHGNQGQDDIVSKMLAWAQKHQTAAEQARRLSQTEDWVDALFDVHGHQIFNLGLFNADPHPGNIILVTPETDQGEAATQHASILGLIDFGQCKRLTRDEQVRVAEFILTIANSATNDTNNERESDEAIATAFRRLGVQTQNDSTPFLADFARLMFGPLQAKHLQRDWHQNLHTTDRLMYFPNELSMVYRTALLLRGLAMSLQFNPSVSDQWKHHAQALLDRERQEQENQARQQIDLEMKERRHVIKGPALEPQEEPNSPFAGTKRRSTNSNVGVAGGVGSASRSNNVVAT